jgi:hypothetical protein
MCIYLNMLDLLPIISNDCQILENPENLLGKLLDRAEFPS